MGSGKWENTFRWPRAYRTPLGPTDPTLWPCRRSVSQEANTDMANPRWLMVAALSLLAVLALATPSGVRPPRERACAIPSVVRA